MSSVARVALWPACLGLLLSCGGLPVEDHENEDDAWAVTSWGDLYEIFAEADGLVAGVPVKSHTHVTVLEDFSPLREGDVSIVLRGAGGTEAVFTEGAPIRDGIYSIEIVPERAGEYELSYRVDSPAGAEEISGGRVLVAAAGGEPGGVIELEAAAERAAEVAGAEVPISFLKEQQWKTAFATQWVDESSLSEVLRAPGRVRPVAGGEVLITSPVDGVLTGARWPHIGREVGAGETLFGVTPRIGASRSLAALSAEVSALDAELEAARHRAERLTELLDTGAASQAELERARSSAAALAARAEAAQRDFATARAARRGEAAGETTIAVRAPFAGRIAEVAATPGEAAAAGQAIVRLVKAEPVWVEVALSADEANRLPVQPAGLLIDGRSFDAEQVRLVSVAPGVSASTGSVLALFEVAASVEELRLGTAASVEILLDTERQGVVVPASAVVDDAGVDITYLQIDGEGFARTEVRIAARRSGRILIEGLPLGGRLVTVGGDAIRRATLVAADPGAGHVH